MRALVATMMGSSVARARSEVCVWGERVEVFEREGV